MLVLGMVGPVVHAVIPRPAAADERTVLDFRDYPYNEGARSPTADEPQSKLWYAHGSWWGLMATRAEGTVKIRRLTDGHSWRSTGTVVDPRANSTADVLWDGKKLYVASRTRETPLRVSRFRFDEAKGSWSRIGPPDEVGDGGSMSAAIAKDSLGRLWVTYVRQGKVMVAHTTSADRGWTDPSQLVVDGISPASGQLSSVVSFDGNIGVMWADQTADRFAFAVHDADAADTEWTGEVAASGYQAVDDHVRLLTAPSPAGTQVMAVVKTSLDEIPGVSGSATLVSVLVRSAGEHWRSVPVGTVADGHNRPIAVVDATNRQLYVIAMALGGVYYKRAPLSDLRFPEGPGQPLMSFGASSLSNPTSTKGPVTADSGLVVLGIGDGSKTYFHAELTIPDRSTTDSLAPNRPAELFAEPTGGCGVELMWPPAQDNVELLRYDLTRDGSYLASTTATSHRDLSASCGTTYEYEVTAVDAAGNVSAPRATDPVTTPAAVTRGTGVWLAGSSAAANTGDRLLALPLPPTQRGDLLIASIDTVGVPVIDAPPGWRLLRRDAQGASLAKLTYARVATGAEASLTRWRLSVATSAVGNALAYRGVAAKHPIVEVSGQRNSPSTVVETPSIGPTPDGSTVVGLFAVGGLVAVSPPDQMVAIESQSASVGPRQRVTGSAAQVSDAGSAAGFVASSSGALPSISQLVVLRPDTAAGR
jgi:hypothetical protein